MKTNSHISVWMANIARRLFTLFLSIVALLSLSCSGKDEPAPSPKTVFAVSPSSITIEEGKTAQVSFVGVNGAVTSTTTSAHLKVQIQATSATIEALSYNESPIILNFASGKETAKLTVQITKKPKSPLSLSETRVLDWLVGQAKEVSLANAEGEVIVEAPKHINAIVEGDKVTLRPLIHLEGEQVITFKSGSEVVKLTMTTKLPTATSREERNNLFYGNVYGGIFDETGNMLIQASASTVKFDTSGAVLEYTAYYRPPMQTITCYPYIGTADNFEFKVSTKGVTLKDKSDNLLLPDGAKMLRGTFLTHFPSSHSSKFEVALIRIVLGEKTLYVLAPWREA